MHVTPLQRNDTVPKNKIVSFSCAYVHRCIDHFRELNFCNDHEMEKEIERVRQEFLQRTADEYRESPGESDGLVRGLETLREEAQRLVRQDAEELVESFGRMGKRRFSLVA